MRRKSALLIAVALVCALFLSACAPWQAFPKTARGGNSGVADLYFENGVIYTADADDSIVEALAVKDGKIVFAGAAAEGAAFKEGAAEIVDLQGCMLLPGFIDTHIHSVTLDFFDFDLTADLSLKKMMGTIEKYVKGNPDKELYAGFGYYPSLFEGEEFEKGPSRERLDEICPDRPMFIYAYDGHAAWFNSRCMELMGLTEEIPNIPGGEIVLNDAGEPWGVVRDTAMSLLPELDLYGEELASVLLDYQSALHSYGYTSIMTLPGNGFFPVPWEGYAALESDGRLRLRVRGAGLVTSWRTDEYIAELAAMQERYDSELVKVTGAKIFIDGVVDGGSAYLLEPYANDPTNVGTPVWDAGELNEAVLAVNELGLLAHFHAIGDAGARMALDAVEYAQENGASKDIRNAMTHLQLVSQEDIPRFSELSVVAAAQPFWQLKAPEYWETVELPALGERAEYQYPMKSFLDSGAKLCFASDYPVTMVPNPFFAIEAGVTRNLAYPEEFGVKDIKDMDDPRYLLWPEERLSVMQMVRGYTIDAAYSIYAEDVTGSIEPGKAADLVIVDRNIFEIDPVELSETQILMTYFGGRLVFNAKS